AEHVDYGKIYKHRFKILQKAAQRAKETEEYEAIKEFVRETKWLPDYALYMALKIHFGMTSWTEWPEEDIRFHKPEAVARYNELLADDVYLFEFIQYEFYKQWNALREYMRERGIGIIGDIPIYVAMDSADVWASPQFFQLDDQYIPTKVSGVPPDYFSEDGQLWGNPLYDWDAMKADGYGWWIRRVDGAAKLYDILRIDHFRGLESYWAVPYGEETARNGEWVKGPGIDFVNVIKNWFPQLQLIAEDLGYLTPEVKQLLEESGLPGMKVLEFAFDCLEPSNYLPHTYPQNCVCYAGTHDNDTIVGWLNDAAEDDVAFAHTYLGLNEAEGKNWGVLRGGMSSVASLFVTQMQDYLGLDTQSRMNTPGTNSGNWQWRMTKKAITKELTEKIAEMTRIYGRV
ncbi:MAG: 4-alpha-glucanotransferase, partial [Oscillospiraceae bacterium]|nr:4-alpha-glucanotransferase [Oscillospiraceae bacterium]